jgi:transcriptional regulator with XRE-family HTH domain
MTIRERPADRGRRRARGDTAVIAGDLYRARTSSGLSLRTVSAASGIDHTRLWRFERGAATELTLPDIAAVGAVVGLDVRLRAYPAGDAIRDAGQQRLLERLHTRLHPSLGWQTEVALPIDGDRRAWDALIRGERWKCGVEAETVLADVQAVERRLALKIRDGGVDKAILLVADTRRNRHALAGAPAALTWLDRDARSVLHALRNGDQPSESAIMFL